MRSHERHTASGLNSGAIAPLGCFVQANAQSPT